MPPDPDYICPVCNLPVDDCICPMCRVCGSFGDPVCYLEHGLILSVSQIFSKELQ